MTERIRSLGSVVLIAALCCAAAACGSGASDGKPSANTPAPRSSAAASRIDACALLPADDVAALLGTRVQGQSTSTNPEMGACKWENPETYESVSLEIGNTGTAVNNVLPPADPAFGFTPGPDGMRYIGGGQVEFPAGNRSNTVQVAVLKMSGDQANAAAVDLARKVAPKIPS